MPDLIEHLTGEELPEFLSSRELYSAWGQLAYNKLTAQTDITFSQIVDELVRAEKPVLAFAILHEWLSDDPQSYPEAFETVCGAIDLAGILIWFRHMRLDWAPLIGTGLSKEVAVRFWRMADKAEGYASLMGRLIEENATDPDYWPALLSLFLRPDLERPPGDLDEGKLTRVDEQAGLFIKELGSSVCENGKLPDDVIDAVFACSDIRIQQRPFTKAVMQLGIPDNFPNPLPSLSSDLAKIFIIKSLLGMGEDGSFKEIPCLEERKRLIDQAIEACPDFHYLATLKRYILSGNDIDVGGLLESLESDAIPVRLVKELIVLRQLSGFGTDLFTEEECEALVGEPRYSFFCIFEAWHTLMRLPGRMRNVLFSRLCPHLNVVKLIKVWPGWFHEFFLDPELDLQTLSLTDRGQLLKSVLDGINSFSEADRPVIWVHLASLHGTGPWSAFSDFLRSRTDRIKSSILLAESVFDHGREFWNQFPPQQEDKDVLYWEVLIYGFLQTAAKRDPTSIPKWTALWVELAKEEIVLSVDEGLKLIFDGVSECLSEQELISMSSAHDSDLRELVPRALIDLETRQALAHAVLLHFDEDPDVVKKAEDSFTEAKEQGRPLFKLTGPDERTPLPEYLLNCCRSFAAWTASIGSVVLGRETQLTFFQRGLGRTKVVGGHEDVSIEVNPLPFLEGHPDGDSIVKGLILHEIGHHYWDIGQSGFKAMRGIAASRNIREIFDILIDERLERAMCRVVPEAATWFDRLGSFAFAQERHKVPLAKIGAYLAIPEVSEVQRMMIDGRLPGDLIVGSNPPEAELTTPEFFNLPEFSFPLMGFLYAFRGGMSPDLFRDLRIGRALQQVPGNLRAMSHREVLQVAFNIAEALEIDTSPSAKSQSEQQGSLMERLGKLSGLLQSLIDRLGPMNREALKELVSDDVSADVDHTFKPAAGPGGSDIDLPNIRRSPGTHPVAKIPERKMGSSGKGLNLGKGIEFDRLPLERTLNHQPALHAALFQRIAPHIRRMRAFFKNLVEEERDIPSSVRGTRLDMAAVRQLAFRPQNHLFIGHEVRPDTGAYIGILIDNSGSMHGKRSKKAKAFGMLIAEAAKGIREIEGHVNAFDDDTFIRLGDFRHHAIATLDAGGGNNDAGGIARAAELALASRKRHRLVIMINDDSPTESSAEAVKSLVADLTRRHGLVLAQVAVDQLQTGAFPNFVDFSQLGFDEAVSAFGSLLRRLLKPR